LFWMNYGPILQNLWHHKNHVEFEKITIRPQHRSFTPQIYATRNSRTLAAAAKRAQKVVEKASKELMYHSIVLNCVKYNYEESGV